MDVRTATPAEIDARWGDLEYRCATLRQRLKEITRRTGPGPAQAERELSEHQATMDKFAAEFERRGGWTRVWVVPGGHAHRSTGCHSLYPDTVIMFYPPLSGAAEDEVVAAAGDRACTHCYPSAPVDRPSTIVLGCEDDKMRARAEREAKRAQKEADKAAKAITAPDGSPLRDRVFGWKIETERAAQMEYCETLSELANVPPHVEASYNTGWRADMTVYAARLLEALAAKHGETADEARERLAPKVKAKTRLDARAWADAAKRYGS